MNAQEKESALKLLLGEYVESYAQSKGKVQFDMWLAQELQVHMPDKSSEEAAAIAREIISALIIQQEKAKSLASAISQGKSKEKWFADEMKALTSDLSESEKEECMANLGKSVSKSKSELTEMITGSSPESVKVPTTPREIAGEICDSSVMGQAVADDAILSSGISADEGSPEAQRVIKEELQSGNDLGLKAAVAGASYTAAEKGLIDVPKENRAGICASIGQTVVEKAKVAGGFIAKTVGEGINWLERAAVSNVVGVAVALKGTAVATSAVYAAGVALSGYVVGATVAATTAVLAPVVLFSAGKELGDKAVRWVQKERPALVKKTAEVLKKGAEVAVNTAKNLGKAAMKWLGFA